MIMLRKKQSQASLQLGKRVSRGIKVSTQQKIGTEVYESFTANLHIQDQRSQNYARKIEDNLMVRAYLTPGDQIDKEQSTKEKPMLKNNDDLVDMKYITKNSGLSDKFFYSKIKKGEFLPPIKLGRSSRWRRSEYENWLEERVKQR